MIKFSGGTSKDLQKIFDDLYTLTRKMTIFGAIFEVNSSIG